MLSSAMVESNHDEERFARIENMVETLGREGAARKIVPAKVAQSSRWSHTRPRCPI